MLVYQRVTPSYVCWFINPSTHGVCWVGSSCVKQITTRRGPQVMFIGFHSIIQHYTHIYMIIYIYVRIIYIWSDYIYMTTCIYIYDFMLYVYIYDYIYIIYIPSNSPSFHQLCRPHHWPLLFRPVFSPSHQCSQDAIQLPHELSSAKPGAWKRGSWL